MKVTKLIRKDGKMLQKEGKVKILHKLITQPEVVCNQLIHQDHKLPIEIMGMALELLLETTQLIHNMEDHKEEIQMQLLRE